MRNIPFDQIKGLDKERETPFKSKVDYVLRNNLQSKSFGCKINNCHTHAGSKIHFDSFVEAELLFHNNYFNTRFAELTYNYILEKYKNNATNKIEKILLIGYETYSELFLHSLKDLINSSKDFASVKADFCVYQTTSKIQNNQHFDYIEIKNLNSVQLCKKKDSRRLKSFSINGANKQNQSSFDLEKTMIFFIVPINTSLSTMDKMVAKFVETLKDRFIDEYVNIILDGDIGKSLNEILSKSDKNIEQYNLLKKKLKDKANVDLSINLNKLLDHIEINEEIIKRIENELRLIDNNLNKKRFLPDSFDKTFTYICLITLQNSNLDLNKSNNSDINFWEVDSTREYLIPSNKFEYLNKNTLVRNFILHDSQWNTSKSCELCFPQESNLLKESVIFGVNRGSVVPMLKIGVIDDPHPLPQRFNMCDDGLEFGKKWDKNLLRIWRLSEFLKYGHIERAGNHFQYYFDTDKFVNNEIKKHEEELKGFFQKIKSSIYQDEQYQDNVQVFNYIIAPRHFSNSEWVHLVNRYVFNSDARVMYFDIDKEYRSNVKAKYSDFTNAIKNIASTGQNFMIRFHFVDDTIHSGATILRAKNLIQSLVGDLDKERISLFHTAILIINRISKDTRQFYLEGSSRNPEIKDMFTYVDVNVSPMRHHEDACTLCKLCFDYDKIERYCATSVLAEECEKIKSLHKLKNAFDINNTLKSQESILEQRFMFFITHLLNERLFNKLYLKFELKPQWINLEDVDTKDILAILNLFYENGNNIITTYCMQTKSICKIDIHWIWQMAFIKVVSRPFFTYHIRCCQASFEFCLKKLDEILSSLRPKSIEQSMIVKSLVKGLCDMNANYLIRQQALLSLRSWAEFGDGYKREKEAFGIERYISKRVFNSNSLIHYIKKDISLSRDLTKAILLENVLLDGGEDGFWGNKKQESNKMNFFDNDRLSIWGKLYLENNVIIKNILSNDDMLNKLIDMLANRFQDIESFYLFDNFKEVWRANTGKSLQESIEVFTEYRKLRHVLNDFVKQDAKADFSKEINGLIKSITGSEELRALAFIHDKTARDKGEDLFEFFTIAKARADVQEATLDKSICKYSDLKPSQAFFHDDNISKIRAGLEDNQDLDIFTIENALLEKSQKSLIMRYRDISSFQNDKSDNSIYLQLWGFDNSNKLHWFVLKILLTLRNEFVDLIKDINLQEYIEERKLSMKQIALSINKSVWHEQGDVYFKFAEKSDYYNKFLDNIKKVNATTDVNNPIVLYDKYWQLLADEQLCSLYRKCVRLNRENRMQNNCFINDKKSITAFERVFIEYRFPKEVVMYRNEGSYVKKVKIHIQGENPDKGLFNWQMVGSEYTIYSLIILMAVNVLNHGIKNDGVAEMTVKLDENNEYVSFCNSVRGGISLTNIEKYMYIPPWVLGENDQHLTMWTLSHARRYDENENGELIKTKWSEISIKVENDYEIRFKLF